MSEVTITQYDDEDRIIQIVAETTVNYPYDLNLNGTPAALIATRREDNELAENVWRVWKIVDGVVQPDSMWAFYESTVLRWARGNSRALNQWVGPRLRESRLGYMVGKDVYGSEEQNMLFYVDQVDAEVVGRFAGVLAEAIDSFNPPCAECNSRSCTEDTEHLQCDHCEDIEALDTMVEISVEHGGEDRDYTLCHDCYENRMYRLEISECRYCSTLVCNDCGQQDRHEYYYCEDHAERYLTFCDECEQTVNTEEDDWDNDQDCCYRCANNMGPNLHQWNYVPELIFHPDIPEENKHLYIGIELEMSWGATPVKEKRKWVDNLAEEYPDLFWCKTDSSVSSGFEAVSHPMQIDWAIENFPVDHFQGAIDIGCRKTHDSTGTHIHMNKEAFTQVHLWKVIQLHFRLADFCGVVGGRGVNASYGQLKGDRADPIRRDLMKIVKRKGNPIDSYERYVALNLRNEYTIEMRYMRGGIAPSEIMKNIEWVKAMYEFTNYITVNDIREGAIDDPGYLLQWIADGDYPNLQDWIQKAYPQPKPLKERTL